MAAKSKKGIIGLVICAVLLVAILIVSIAVGTNFENIAQANATPVASVSKTQASLNGMQGGRNIEREGAVLLKNENDTLPLGDKGVTLLGTRSHHYVLGGTGSAGRRDDIVGITVENYCAQPSVFSDGLPVTSKKDRNYHGFGMKSMRYIAEKYGGSLIVSQENEKFVLAIVLSMRSVKSA